MSKISTVMIHRPRVKVDESKHIENFKKTQTNYNMWAGLAPPDAVLSIAVALLCILGFVIVTSASIPKAGDNGGWVYGYSVRQLTYIIVGLIAGLIAYKTPSSFWFKHSFPILFIGIAMLAIIQIPGVSPVINGSRRWIPLGIVNVQTSEFVRICMIIYAASFLQRQQNTIHNSLYPMLRLMFILLIVGVLLLLQPDFGSTVVIFSIVLGMMFLAGVCLIRFAYCAIVAGVLGTIVLFMESYRVERLMSFLDPWKNEFGMGYQLTNSLIAIGRGGTTGVGIGESIEKHRYLPEAHTDFIFSILAEEMGLIGVCFLMLLYGLVVWRAFVIASNADKVRRRFQSCVAYGVGLWIGMQALVNMSVASGLLPTKGLTLPLISYGGSSVVASLILIAMLLRIDSESKYQLQQEKNSLNNTLSKKKK